MRRIEFIQFIPAGIDPVWDFFSAPANLSKITPPEMDFVITTPSPAEMYRGMLIQYKVNPFKWLRVNWLTEITQMEKAIYFIDEQRTGPYSIWHHEHHFSSVDGGTQMHDILFYKLPFGIFGRLADWLVVHKRVKRIFEFRTRNVDTFFPVTKKNTSAT